MSSLPEPLVNFRGDLEQAIGREVARGARRRRRRLTLTVAVAVPVSLALVLALPIVLPEHGPSVVERAAAALNPRGNTILHWTTVDRFVPRHGAIEIYSHEVWQERRSPFASREIDYINVPDRPGLVGGHVTEGRRIARAERSLSGLWGVGPITDSFFDPGTNTIYVSQTPDSRLASSQPRSCSVEGVKTSAQLGNCMYPLFAPGPRPGTLRVIEVTRLNDHRPWLWRVDSRVVSETEAERIRAGLLPQELPDFNREKVQNVLKHASVVVGGHVRFDGRDAIPLTWNYGRSVYLVDARTYEPIQLQVRNQRGTRTTRYLVYAKLALDPQTRALVSLRAQHPGARINRDPKAFLRAAIRLSVGG